MSNEEKTTIDKTGLLILTTLIALVAGVFSPLIAWFTIKNNLDPAQKEYLTGLFNFELTLFIVGLIAGAILPFILGVFPLINLVILIIAAIKCSKKEAYKFPLTITLIK